MPAATIEPSLTTSTSSLAIQARQRRQDPEQRKALRAGTRQSIEQRHAVLDQVLPLDADTRSKLLELLTDLQMESGDRYANEPRSGLLTGRSYPSLEAAQAAAERERFGANSLQRAASQATRDLQRIRELLGEARFQQYIDYEMTQLERQEAAHLDGQLAADDKLDASQRERLILLLHERRQQQNEALQVENSRSNGELARRGYAGIAAEGEGLQRLRDYEWHLRRVESGSKWLLVQLPDILTPRQLAIIEANEAKQVAEQLQLVKRMRKRIGIDTEKPLPPDPAAVLSSRAPLRGRVRLDVSIKVNDSAITQRSLLADNGGLMSFEIASLTIEVVPILFDDGWRELTMKFYEPDGKGGRRLIRSGISAAEPMQGADPVQKLDTAVLSASRGYAIIGNFTLSTANL
jgi:hypothetical protein